MNLSRRKLVIYTSSYEFLWYTIPSVHWYEGQLLVLHPSHHIRRFHNLEHLTQSN